MNYASLCHVTDILDEWLLSWSTRESPQKMTRSLRSVVM